MVTDSALPSTSLGRVDSRDFDESAEKATSSAKARRSGQLVGTAAVVLVLVDVFLLLTPSITITAHPSDRPILLGVLLFFGVAFAVTGLVVPRLRSRDLLAVHVDEIGVQFRMSSPPNADFRWDSRGAWVSLSRGFVAGSAEEDHPKGWVIAAGGVRSTVGGEAGTYLIAAARARGFVVRKSSFGDVPGRLKMESYRLDHPANPPPKGKGWTVS